MQTYGRMFFPSRAFAQQNNPPPNTSRYRSYLMSNYPSGLENQSPQNFYSRNYDYNYKLEQPYSGSSYYRSRSSSDQSTSRYYGSDKPSYNVSNVSKYYPSAIYNNDSNRPTQAPVYQYKSRYDCYDETSLETRYGIKISNERTYYQPSYQYQNRTQMNSQYQNTQEPPSYCNPSKYKTRNETNYYASSPKKVENKKRRRAESVNPHANYKSDFYNFDQPNRNCDYISSNIRQDQPVDFSYIAHKYGNFQKKNEKSNFQRKYPLILTNDEPLFKTAQSPNQSNDSSSEYDSSQSSSSPDIKTTKSHKKEEMRPFDPNRQLFSKAQNEVFQQYAEQRINEIRAARGQPPYQPPTQSKQPQSNQQSHQIPSRQEPNYYLPNYDRKPYESQIVKTKSKSKRNASVQQKRQPEVKFAFKSNEQEPAYTSQRSGSSNNYAPDSHDDLVRRTSPNKLSPTSHKYTYNEQYDYRQQQHADKHHDKQKKQKKSKHDRESPQSPKNTYSKKNMSSDSDDKEDSADIVSRLAKFRKTIEESKKTERQLGELLGCNETPKVQSSTEEGNNNFLSETDSLASAKANQNEFLSEPSLIFEGQ